MSAINWFEIPVSDMDRAVKFYSEILGTPMEVFSNEGVSVAFLPMAEGDVGGSLIEGPGYVPSQEGSLVYINGNPDLSAILARVGAAGGTVLTQKSPIGENGFIAIFTDIEGNRVGLHSVG